MPDLDENLLDNEQEEQKEPEKTFTQAELDKIVADRLARAKRPDDYEDLKELLSELEEYGYPQSPKEAKELLKQQKAQEKAQKQLEELEEQAELQGTSPELLKKMADLEAKVIDLESEKREKQVEIEKNLAEAKAKEESDAAWQTQIDEITEAHPEIDLETLEANQKFIKFIKGKNGMTLKELYEDFIDFIGETESEAVKKAMSKAERSTGSGKGSGTGGGGKLTDAEKQTLKDWNAKNPKYLQMTETEFLANKNR